MFFFDLVKSAALNCYNLLDGDATTSINTLKIDIEIETIDSILSCIENKEGRDKLNSYHDELLVCGLLKPAIADDVKVIIQRNLQHDTFMLSLLDNLKSSRSKSTG